MVRRGGARIATAASLSDRATTCFAKSRVCRVTNRETMSTTMSVHAPSCSKTRHSGHWWISMQATGRLLNEAATTLRLARTSKNIQLKLHYFAAQLIILNLQCHDRLQLALLGNLQHQLDKRVKCCIAIGRASRLSAWFSGKATRDAFATRLPLLLLNNGRDRVAPITLN